MTAFDPKGRSVAGPMALLAATVFASAGLVFLVQPMAGRLVLPSLGGAPSVWNTSMAFFQAALLAGYAYAHLLQRLRSLRVQVAVHLALLLLAAVVLPLHVTALFGAPSTSQPALWLVGVLAVSLGAPFAMLSSTAPLIQAWYARGLAKETGREPYGLYAASNLGSLLALSAYPLLVEPSVTLKGQTLGWSVGYGLFVLLIAVSGVVLARYRGAGPVEAVEPAPSTTWRDRLAWLGLAAIPSSLMLGVTAHIATDIASAPFLWVAPLGLYLLTFILVFRDRPMIGAGAVLPLQALALALCIAMTPFRTTNLLMQIGIHLSAFFLTALVCHQALYARRPPAARLTEFYMWMSLGGVVGGAFNAFVAPLIFSDVWEYPLMLALSVLARPWWGDRRGQTTAWIYCIAGIVFPVAAVICRSFDGPDFVYLALLTAGAACAIMVRDRAWMMLAVLAVLSIAAAQIGDRTDVRQTWRSFFGVLRESRTYDESLGGEVYMLAHGTTLHGAQAQAPEWKCRPTTYYAEGGPIGRAFLTERARKPALRIGAVGLGTGAVAAYVRPGDHLTFFEIDPLVIRLSGPQGRFTFVRDCAKGPVDFQLGDARLTLARQPDATFDLLLIDAFSSDAIPTHLMTVEALRGYLAKLKPDGVMVMHLSNRNLELRGVAEAVAVSAGAPALIQRHYAPEGVSTLWESDEDVLIAARTPAALAAYREDPAWAPVKAGKMRPWTDDYTNVFGALAAQMKDRWAATSQ
jgi:SAM-dependent methyltransferase